MIIYEYLASEAGRLTVWGLVTRGMGLIYVICLGSILVQVSALLGSRGIMPIARQIDHMRRHLPWYQGLRLNPSLLWIARGDFALKVMVAAGVLAGLGVIWGGPYSRLLLLICWLVVLSLRHGLRMYYPWDSFMLESGFLAIFLPPLQALPSLETSVLPPPLLIFAFHFLLCRLLFGFGKTKFVGFSLKDGLYIKYFLMNKPLVSRIGWYLGHGPEWFHRLSLAGMAFVELICPFLVLFPGPTRLIGVAGIAGLMVGIQLSGNFGYFNLLTLVVCISCLDHSSALTDVSLPGLLAPEHLPFTLAFAVIVAASPAYVAVNNWLTYSFAEWPALARLRPGLLKTYLAFLRAITPLAMVQGYGVFSPRSAPPVRWLPVIQGSDDGETWKTFEYRFTTTHGRSTPPFIAPYQPRLDHMGHYETLGIDGTGYFAAISFSDPLRFTPAAMLDLTIQRLLEKDSPVLGLMGTNPFPEDPPRLMRVSVSRATQTTPKERASTGDWYHCTPAGPHIAATEHDPSVFDHWLPPPELFHFEAMRWRRRARTCDGVSAEDYAAFWDTFVPFIRETAAATAARTGQGPDSPFCWQNLPGTVLALRGRFTREEVRAFHLTLARLTTAVLARLDAVFSRPAKGFLRNVAGLKIGQAAPEVASLGDGAGPEDLLQALAAWPHGPLRSWFRLGLMVHRLILISGREGWERLAGDSFRLGERISTAVRLSRSGRRTMAAAAEEIGLDLELVKQTAIDLTLAGGFFLEGAVNYDQVARHASRGRILYSSSGFSPSPSGALPGVYEMIGELLEHPELEMITGWGADARVEPAHEQMRMVFRDGRWSSPQETPA